MQGTYLDSVNLNCNSSSGVGESRILLGSINFPPFLGKYLLFLPEKQGKTGSLTRVIQEMCNVGAFSGVLKQGVPKLEWSRSRCMEKRTILAKKNLDSTRDPIDAWSSEWHWLRRAWTAQETPLHGEPMHEGILRENTRVVIYMSKTASEPTTSQVTRNTKSRPTTLR